MSNGTKPGVLLTEIFSGDGPFMRVAEDFLNSTCTGCGCLVDRDGAHHDLGYFCSPCWSRNSGF